MLSGRALAATLLAWSLVRTTWARMMGRKTGLALFHENYEADRLPAVDAADRERLQTFSRCVACGLCDVGEADRVLASRGAYPGLMSVVLASTRSMPDFDAASVALGHIPEDVLREKEAICPAGVPFVELSRFVKRKASGPKLLVLRSEEP
ncbi:MAG: hypothetical protein U0441_29915 [Polyangiaceae bacterium]